MMIMMKQVIQLEEMPEINTIERVVPKKEPSKKAPLPEKCAKRTDPMTARMEPTTVAAMMLGTMK